MGARVVNLAAVVFCSLAAFAEPTAPAAWSLTPAEAVEASVRHFEALPEGLRNQTRLLLLKGSTVEARQRTAMGVSLLLNSVGRSRLIVVPAPIDEGWNLLAVDLAAYADAEDAAAYVTLFEAWELLAKEDPYFHLRTEVVAAGETEIKQVTVDGGWIRLEAAEALRELSGSFGAVLRSDFFAAAVGERHYYLWAGVPETENELLVEIGVDRKAVETLAAQPSANLLRSNVTRKPRRVIYRPGALGATFQTKDVDAEAPPNDPLRNPLNVATQTFVFAATEWFYARPNGTWGTAIFDAAGKRQDAVADRVAKDHQDVTEGDGIVRPFWKCVRCHERGGSAGLQPFVDDQSFLLAKVGVGSPDPAVAQRVAELYDPARLGKAMARAREDYEDAVARATGGLKPAEATEALVELIVDYRDRAVTPAAAAAETGTTVERFAVLLSGQGTEGTRDPILLALALGRDVNRAAWETSYPEAALRTATAD